MQEEHPKSELRRDLVSGDWILLAKARANRYHDLLQKKQREIPPREGCPFENPQATTHGEPFLVYRKPEDHSDWLIQVVQNKYPAVNDVETFSDKRKVGLFDVQDGIGAHELLLFRNHEKPLADLHSGDIDLMLKAIQERYLDIGSRASTNYISMFHNWGSRAGASIYHPHLQIISLPIVPPDIEDSLQGSKRYFKRFGHCVHCAVVEWEQEEKNRIIFENDEAIVIAPFVSRVSYEVRIFPKKHSPYFEESTPTKRSAIADALYFSLSRIKEVLGDPDLNFFIHTAPVKNKDAWLHYHWHIEILPRMSFMAGLELGTGIDIVVVDPDEVAALLRKTA